MWPLLLLGCSSAAPSPATIVILAGQESDAFTRAPVPDHLTIDAVGIDGTSKQIARVAWPVDSFDIGDLDKSQTAAIAASLEDSADRPLLRGQTLYYSLATLYGHDVPVFVGRVGEFSRPPGALPIARSGGALGIISSQFLVVAGGSATLDANGSAVPASTISAYDLGAWNVVSASLQLPRSPTAMPIVLGEYALLIDETGATWFDFATHDQAEATAPAGVSFADVSGGQVVFGDDGSAYVVGATRSSAASDVVLRVRTDLTLEAEHLNTPRKGASATWLSGHGLVVAGGAASGAGIEVLSQDASAFSNLAFPSDATSGAGAAGIDADRIVLVGGLNPADSSPSSTRLVDVSCTSTCAAAQLDASPPLPVVNAAVYAVDTHAVLLVGDEQQADASSRTAAFLLEGIDSTPSITEVALREPRQGALSVPLMGNTVGVLGGYSADGTPVRSLEVFVRQ